MHVWLDSLLRLKGFTAQVKNKVIEIQLNLILWTPRHYALVFFILSLGKTFKIIVSKFNPLNIDTH